MNYITITLLFVVIFYLRYRIEKWFINYLCSKSNKYKEYYKNESKKYRDD